MSSIRSRPETGQLFLDFKFNGARMREQTALPDTPANRKRLQKVLDRIEGEIAIGCFDYEKTFGKPLPKPVAYSADRERRFRHIVNAAAAYEIAHANCRGLFTMRPNLAS